MYLKRLLPIYNVSLRDDYRHRKSKQHAVYLCGSHLGFSSLMVQPYRSTDTATFRKNSRFILLLFGQYPVNSIPCFCYAYADVSYTRAYVQVKKKENLLFICLISAFKSGTKLFPFQLRAIALGEGVNAFFLPTGI